MGTPSVVGPRLPPGPETASVPHRDLGYTFSGRSFRVEVIEERASEVFLASTLRDAQGVVRWNEKDLPHGPVTRAVREVWRGREPELLGV